MHLLTGVQGCKYLHDNLVTVGGVSSLHKWRDTLLSVRLGSFSLFADIMVQCGLLVLGGRLLVCWVVGLQAEGKG